jgi:hypothetical protein
VKRIAFCAVVAAAAIALVTGPTAVATPSHAASVGTQQWGRIISLPPNLARQAPATAAAASYEEDTAVAGTPPSFDPNDCIGLEVSGHIVMGTCFQPYGDKIWVEDTYGDGYAAVASWVNYLRDASGNWDSYRSGSCTNSLTAGHWGVCNKDFYEDSTSPNAAGGQGSGIRLYPCTSNVCTTDYAWIRNNG